VVCYAFRGYDRRRGVRAATARGANRRRYLSPRMLDHSGGFQSRNDVG
jgi:hypothetical protein